MSHAIPATTANADNMEAMGGAMRHTAAELGDMVLSEQEDANRTRVLDARNQLEARSLALRTELYKAKGQDALQASQAAYADFNGFQQQLSQSLGNDRQRQMFAAHAGESTLNFAGHVEPYVSQQIEAYKLNTTLVAGKTAQDNAVASWDTPALRDKSIGDMLGAMDEAGRMQGMPQNLTDRNKALAVSEVHTGVIANLIANNRGIDAQTYFNEHKGQIAGKDLAATTDHVLNAVTSEGTDRWFGMAAAGDTSGTDQLISDLRARGVPEKNLFQIQALGQHQLFTTALNEVDKRLNAGDPQGAKLAALEWSQKFKQGGDTFYRQMADRADAAIHRRTELDAAKQVWLDAFTGHATGPLPADDESKKAAVDTILRTRMGSEEDVAKFFAVRGLAQPSQIKEHLNQAFSPGTTPQEAFKGLSILQAMGDGVGQSVAGAVNDGHKGLIASTILRLGRTATADELKDVVQVMTSPVAAKGLDAIEERIAGSKTAEGKVKVAGLDIKDLLGHLPTAQGAETFFAEARYEMAKAVQNGVPVEDLKNLGPNIAARYKDMTARVAVPQAEGPSIGVPVEGTGGGWIFGRTQLQETTVPKGLVPDAQAARMLTKAMQTEMSDRFGYQTAGINHFTGQYRPDLAFQVPGNDGYFVPSLLDGLPLGFFQFEPSTGKVAGTVDPIKNADQFRQLVGVMSHVAPPEHWMGDPSLRYSERYPARTIMALPENETSGALLKRLRDWSDREFSILNDGRLPNLKDPAQKAAYLRIMDRGAKIHGWDGLGTTTPTEPTRAK